MNDAYIEKTYEDGDKEIHFPLWRQVLQKEVTNSHRIDLEKAQEDWSFISENEIALKHPKTGSTIKLADDGSIEMYVNEDTGIRLDPTENSIIFFGDSIHFATKEMRIHTKPHSFIWNNHNINPYLYYGEAVGDERFIPKVQTTTTDEDGDVLRAATTPIFQKQTRKQYYDETVTALIESLGIETARSKREAKS